MSEIMLGDALRTVCGPLGDLHQKLASPAGEEWMRALKRFLRKEDPWKFNAADLPTWMTIQRGGHISAEESRKMLTAPGCRISNWADVMLTRADFNIAADEEFDLVIVSNADLGFTDGAKRQDTYKRAGEFGLKKLPHWGGPAIREAYKTQPKDERLLVAMDPVRDSSGGLSIFYVEHDDWGGLWLDGAEGRPGAFLGADSRWVFVRPRK